MKRYTFTSDVAVIGGGASGMFAALTAAKSGSRPSVTVYEAGERVGAKLSVTGNGRCNISNVGVSPERYHGSRRFAAAALELFSVQDAVRELGKYGVLITEEKDGKLFPYSLQASSVTDCLRFSCAEAGIALECGCTVRGVKAEKNGFVLTTERGEAFAKRVIMATGSVAGVAASEETVYSPAVTLGHRLTKLLPSVVKVKTAAKELKALNGIKVNATVSAVKGGRLLRKESGEVLFTEYGLSGPPVLQLSRLVSSGECDCMLLDLMPEFSLEETEKILLSRGADFRDRPLSELLSGMLNKRVGQTVLKLAGYSPENRKAALIRAAGLIKALPVKVTGVTGMRSAQVCAGGIETADFNPMTMESRLVKGFYVTGEALNVDGDCGGFNLQWAWTSGYLAGKAVAEDIR